MGLQDFEPFQHLNLRLRIQIVAQINQIKNRFRDFLLEIPGPCCQKFTLSCGTAFDFGRYDRRSHASNETSKSGR